MRLPRFNSWLEARASANHSRWESASTAGRSCPATSARRARWSTPSTGHREHRRSPGGDDEDRSAFASHGQSTFRASAPARGHRFRGRVRGPADGGRPSASGHSVKVPTCGGFSQDTKAEALKRARLFEGLSKKELTQLARVSEDLEVPAGDALCKEGDIGREFFVIVEGEIEVTVKGKIAERGEGDFVGEIALLEDTSRTATVTAKTPLRLFVLTREDFRSLVRQTPRSSKRSCRRSPAGSFSSRATQPSPSSRGTRPGRPVGPLGRLVVLQRLRRVHVASTTGSTGHASSTTPSTAIPSTRPRAWRQ